ncbi:MAG: hypothetical protein ABI890_10175, partial [Lapillicoccus sp.]
MPRPVRLRRASRLVTALVLAGLSGLTGLSGLSGLGGSTLGLARAQAADASVTSDAMVAVGAEPD